MNYITLSKTLSIEISGYNQDMSAVSDFARLAITGIESSLGLGIVCAKSRLREAWVPKQPQSLTLKTQRDGFAPDATDTR